jgi:riboflavin synthase
MFTGLIEGLGSLESLSGDSGGATARIGCGEMASGLGVGDSVAVDGVCLTVVRTGPLWFDVEISPETLSRTSLSGKEKGCVLNLERPLRLSDRLGGHLVQGHVDGVGWLTDVRPEGQGKRVRVRAPEALQRYLIEKGSVALDGVSLTIAAVRGTELEVALIPHTLRVTSLGQWRVASRVNIEVDLVAKYVESLLVPYVGAGLDRKER